jgi:peptide subunit release factor RF-3
MANVVHTLRIKVLISVTTARENAAVEAGWPKRVATSDWMIMEAKPATGVTFVRDIILAIQVMRKLTKQKKI